MKHSCLSLSMHKTNNDVVTLIINLWTQLSPLSVYREKLKYEAYLLLTKPLISRLDVCGMYYSVVCILDRAIPSISGKQCNIDLLHIGKSLKISKVSRFHKSKQNRQHNGQKKKYKRTNNDLQNNDRAIPAYCLYQESRVK